MIISPPENVKFFRTFFVTIAETCFLDNIEIFTENTRIPKGGAFRFAGLKKIEKNVVFLGKIDRL